MTRKAVLLVNLGSPDSPSVPDVRRYLREFLMDGFEHYQLAGLALLYLKNESKAETEKDLTVLITAAANDARERARRERLLQYVRSTAETDIIELAKHSLTATGEYPGSSINSLPAEARH